VASIGTAFRGIPQLSDRRGSRFYFRKQRDGGYKRMLAAKYKVPTYSQVRSEGDVDPLSAAQGVCRNAVLPRGDWRERAHLSLEQHDSAICLWPSQLSTERSRKG
jgi:hypothetical protein